MCARLPCCQRVTARDERQQLQKLHSHWNAGALVDASLIHVRRLRSVQHACCLGQASVFDVYPAAAKARVSGDPDLCHCTVLRLPRCMSGCAIKRSASTIHAPRGPSSTCTDCLARFLHVHRRLT